MVEGMSRQRSHIGTTLFAFTLGSVIAVHAMCQVQGTSCTAEGCHADLLGKRVVHPAAKDDCGSCHEKTGAPHPGKEGNEFNLAVEGADLCLSCHEVISEEGSVHPPAQDGECLTCHDPHASELRGLLTQPLPDLCVMCHDGYQQPQGDSGSTHGVIESEKSCLACHRPHDSSLENLLVQEQPDLCLGCHTKPVRHGERTLEAVGKRLKASDVVHPALDMSGCATCHVPHVSEFSHLLTAAFPKGFYGRKSTQAYEICFTCHDPAILEAKNDPDATQFRSGDRNLHFVHVLRNKSRSCVACHDMHASNLPHLLREFVWFGRWKMPLKVVQTDDGGACTPGCHQRLEYKR